MDNKMASIILVATAIVRTSWKPTPLDSTMSKNRSIRITSKVLLGLRNLFLHSGGRRLPDGNANSSSKEVFLTR